MKARILSSDNPQKMTTSLLHTAKNLSIVLTLILVSGCSTGTPLTTPSGKPEVFIAGASSQKVRSAIIDRGMSLGWTLERESASSIVFLRTTSNPLAKVLLASNYDTRVLDRIRYTMASLDGGIKVYCSIELVGNHGSAFERVTPINHNNYKQAMQKGLEAIKAEVQK